MSKRIALEKYNHKKLEWLNDFLKIGAVFAVFFILFRVIIGFSFVSGDSMAPNLVDGEGVVYLRTVKDYKKGDVICLWVPSGNYYVKRVVAVGGDVVSIRDGQLYVNDELVTDEHAYGETIPEEGAVIYPYTVREGNVFVLGDNREGSMDSRAFGEVNKMQIRGKILFHFGKWYFKKL